MRLRRQILLSYIPLLIIPIAVIGLITRGATEYGLTVLVTNEGGRAMNMLVGRFANYYNRDNTWDGIQTVFTDIVSNAGPRPNDPNPRRDNRTPEPFSPGPGQGGQPGVGTPAFINPGQVVAQQIILADKRGVILASNVPESVGQMLVPETITRSVPIYDRDRAVVGLLVAGAALGVLDVGQRQLLETVNVALFVSGLVSAFVMIGIGLLVSGQIAAPIRDLIRAVQSFRRGERIALPVRAKNEIGELTAAFNMMAEDVERQQNLRKQMVADIAHDLRTPLSVITLEIEGIKQGLQTPEQAATSLAEEVDWLTHLVEDLHTLSLIDAKQLSVYPEQTDLRPFLESVYKNWRTAAEAQGRQFTLEPIRPDLPFVQIDPPRMRQVLGNLINNAFSHTPPGAAVTLCADQTDGQVLIRVMDSGPGIPPESLPRLFERFYRVDKSRTRRVGDSRAAQGSGLGLTIAYQLTALQGGTLSVQSQPGQGARFTVALRATV